MGGRPTVNVEQLRTVTRNDKLVGEAVEAKELEHLAQVVGILREATTLLQTRAVTQLNKTPNSKPKKGGNK